jgi:hypothetical protein
MKSKAELIPQFLELIKAEACYEGDFKVVTHEDYTAWSIPHKKASHNYCLQEVRNHIKINGWKENPSEGVNNYHTNHYDAYITMLYNHVTDKLTISMFRTGIGYSVRGTRYFPYSNHENLFCWSKSKMYSFCLKTNKPRWFTTKSICGITNLAKPIFKLVTGAIDEHFSYILGYHNVIAGKTIHGSLMHKYGQFPKKLLCLPADSLDTILKIVPKNDLNRVTQCLNSDWYKKTPLMHSDLGLLLAYIMKISVNESWLISDWANDHKTLGKKISLKITSINRIRDEHRKLSRKIILRGVNEIKIHKRFNTVKKLLKKAPFEWEVIDNKNRLMDESMIMEHCVATYATKINSGMCCILHVKDEAGEGYTLEIDPKFNILQFRGFRNKPAPAKLEQNVKNFIIPSEPAVKVKEDIFEYL